MPVLIRGREPIWIKAQFSAVAAAVSFDETTKGR
jgi:hypothetical protein